MTASEAKLNEIENVFQRLGLATAADRGGYLVASPRPATPNFNVVISSTSTPFPR